MGRKGDNMELINIEEIKDTVICIHHQNDLLDYSLNKSVETYGQLRPILINKNNEIIIPLPYSWTGRFK